MRSDTFRAHQPLNASSKATIKLLNRLLQYDPLHIPWPGDRISSSCTGNSERKQCLAFARGDTVSRSDGDLFMDSRPLFDQSPRLASTEETLAIAVGARLTPEQQAAKQLQLPITLRIRQPPGVPTERQVMAQIQASATWQELEAVVYQHRGNVAATVIPVSSSSSGLAPSVMSSGQQQQQQEKQPLLKSAQRQPRRRQQVRPLSIESQPSQWQGQQQQPSQQGPIATAIGYDQVTAVSRPSAVLNHLHTTEAIRQLSKLLPTNPNTINPEDRSRAAALIDFLARQALALAHCLAIDPRGVANIASGLAKLQHKDDALLAALQEAALLQIEGFNAQEVAVLLGALVKLGARLDPQLFEGMQQHILNNLHLFKHQSMANTIWALAKMNTSSKSTKAEAGCSLAAGAVSVQLVSALVARCYPQMHFWSSRHLTQAAWGLARLGAKPDVEWCKALLLATYKRLSKMSPQDLANTISALPELGATPNQVWQDAFCTTAAAKMRLMQPVGLYSVLFGLARVKQAHSKAVKREAKAEQQQQQQRATIPVQATPTHLAEQGGKEPHVQGVRVRDKAAASPAQLKMLRASLMWLQRRQHQLTSQQLAGVIMSLAELLPEDFGGQQHHDSAKQQSAHQQQGSTRDGSAAVVQQDEAANKLVEVEQEQQRQWQQLRSLLGTLLEGWMPLMEQQQLTVGLAKKQAKLLDMAWRRLLWHTAKPT